MDRRPLKTRNKAWAGKLTSKLIAWRFRPNAISVLSIVMALVGAAGILAAGRLESPLASCLLFLVGALGIQLRLLCNMLDGMVAVEGKMTSPVGDLYNDMPDRISDVALLLAAGYAIVGFFSSAVVLGWTAAVLAVMTAYVRLLGATAGTGHCFFGPMAKPHRMALLTAGCVLSAVEVWCWPRGWVLWIVLIVLVAGMAVTILRRLIWIYRQLQSPVEAVE